MTKIKEIFSSIQGEGPFIGYKQLFVRFCRCNLNCNYCDTDFREKNANDYTVEKLIGVINQNLDCHSISLTGGEPLLEQEFLKQFLPKSPLPIYLETNGTLYENLEEIINYVDYISMDIKLPSCTGLKPLWEVHENFLKIATKKMTYVKVVFDEKIKEDEIERCCNICKNYGVELVLQPKMNGNDLSISSEVMIEILNKFLTIHKKTRLIPQVHKFLNVE